MYYINLVIEFFDSVNKDDVEAGVQMWIALTKYKGPKKVVNITNNYYNYKPTKDGKS